MKIQPLHKTPRILRYPRQRSGEFFFCWKSEVGSPKKLKLKNPIRLGVALGYLLEHLRKDPTEPLYSEGLKTTDAKHGIFPKQQGFRKLTL